MNPERLRQIEELNHLACERSTGEREVFLQKACRNDEELLGQVRSLLAAGGSGGPMERPVLELAGRLLGDRPDTEWAAGTAVGPYQIVSHLGKGGMGDVYKARDTRLGREVAIKVSAAQFSGRFAREARAVAALNHPHVCTLHDVGPNYLVMEFVVGENLAERLRKGLLPLTLTLEYGA